MTRVLTVVNDPIAQAHDGFGSRSSGIDSENGEAVERLDLAPELVEHSGFVAALGERVARFATVRHASYVHLRRLDRPSADRLELVSDYTAGWRLSELLAESSENAVPVDITIVIAVLRQLLPAVALYGRHNREAAIGSLAPERLIVTPQARVVIAEHAFGPAIEKLNLGRDRLWRELRVSMPPSAGLPRANQRADANAIGVIALSLLLGRVLHVDEFPSQLQPLLEGAQEYRDGQPSPLSASFAGWLSRALQVDVRRAFQTPAEAQLAFETVLASDRSYVTTPARFEEWVKRAGGAGESGEARQAAQVTAASEQSVVQVPTPALPVPPALPDPPAPARRLPLILAAAVIAVLLGVIGWLSTRETEELRAGEGELVVQTRAAGAAVTIDGKPVGVTPLTIALPSGAHVVEVKIGNGEPRVVPVMIRAGVQTAQYVEMPEPLLPITPPSEKGRRR